MEPKNLVKLGLVIAIAFVGVAAAPTAAADEQTYSVGVWCVPMTENPGGICSVYTSTPDNEDPE